MWHDRLKATVFHIETLVLFSSFSPFLTIFAAAGGYNSYLTCPLSKTQAFCQPQAPPHIKRCHCGSSWKYKIKCCQLQSRTGGRGQVNTSMFRMNGSVPNPTKWCFTMWLWWMWMQHASDSFVYSQERVLGDEWECTGSDWVMPNPWDFDWYVMHKKLIKLCMMTMD